MIIFIIIYNFILNNEEVWGSFTKISDVCE